MPQVDIREIDSTGVAAVEYDDYVVMVPIAGIKEKLYSDWDVFKEDTTASGSSVDKSKQGYKIAKFALLSGLKVLVVPYTKGMDLTQYEDKGIYDIRFMVMGDALDEAKDEDVKAFAEALIKAAADRGNTTAIIDIPEGETDSAADVSTWANSLNNVVVTRAPDTFTGESVIENGYSYMQFISPWVKFEDPETGDMLSDNVPGSIIYLNCFAHNIHLYPDWFATAGSVRGVSTFGSVKPEHKFGDADVAVLQKRKFPSNPESGVEHIRAVNPICEIRPYGNIVWGNRTGYPLTQKEPGLKASSFLNIRQLCCDIKNVLYRASRKYTFEPNSDTLWANFTSAIKPLLEDMRSNQGILGYKIIKEKTLQKATLKARIRIIPIEAVEDFDLTVEMTDSIVEVNG